MSYEKRSRANDYWWWADALYMVMPVMTKMYLLTGDEGYLDKMYENWKYCNSIMYDKETGLYFRDGKYVYPAHKTESGKKDFWARGDGWVIAAFAKVLKDLPKNYKHRQEIVQYYQKLAAALVSCQQEEGYWTRSLLDRNRLRDVRHLEQPSTATDFSGVSITVFCQRHISLLLRRHGNISQP